MNVAGDCHEIPDCPGIYVDAFRGSYLTHKTKVATRVFILSHYHGDHYGSLPRESNYQGPAKIHCTPVTAALLIQVHGVHENLVVPHALGETWSVSSATSTEESSSSLHEQQSSTQITFFDANHCPGAAIILFQAHNGKFHLHTGDMRYHERMKSYTMLREAALTRKIDTVLLDTTYAHPKHSFLKQYDAVDLIASQVVQLLQPSEPKTLVLLSCYSIGKEKVLWEVAQRTGKRIYANERKRRMLTCIQSPDDSSSDPSLQIIDHCTDDPAASDVHIVSMGVAGQIWPFFQPNYAACLQYLQQQQQQQESHTAYQRVVAFLPTGWADATNWNKKNACKTIVKEGVTISVRLVAYSEHSTFDELQCFVDFLQPRQVIPTVYSDDRDRRKIQSRFRIDTKRAKEAFFKSMLKESPTKSEPLRKVTLHPNDANSTIQQLTSIDQQIQSSESSSCRIGKTNVSPIVDLVSDSDDDNDSGNNDDNDDKAEHETKPSSCITASAVKRRPSLTKLGTTSNSKQSTEMKSLISMGFNPQHVEATLKVTRGMGLEAAIDQLLQPAQSATISSPITKSNVTSSITLPRTPKRRKMLSPKKTADMKSIKSFFSNSS